MWPEAWPDYEELMAVPTEVNVPLAFLPRVVIAPMQTTMIKANMTAYSTAVGPSSLFKKSATEQARRDNMTGSSFLVKKCQETTYDLLNRSVSCCEGTSRHPPCKQLRVLWAALFRWVRPSLGQTIGLSNAQVRGGPSRTPLTDKQGVWRRWNGNGCGYVGAAPFR